MDEKEYSLMEHLAELRTRLGRALIGVVAVAIGAFAVSDELLAILRKPMDAALQERYGPTAKFITTDAAEYFMCQMKASLVAGLFLASPWVLYQVWLFISPGLYDHEKKYVSWFVVAGALCFCGGAVFGYLLVFPTMYSFFVNHQPADVMMMPSLAANFSFSLKTLVAFGVVFETPVVIFILSIAGIVDPHQLGNYRRYVVVIAFIVGAILTPSPDIYSQVLMAVPLLALYEIGVFVSKIATRVSGTPLSRKDRAAAHAAKEAAKDAPEPSRVPDDKGEKK